MAALSTLTIKDASSVNRTMRVWDEESGGAGTGPFSFAARLHDNQLTPTGQSSGVAEDASYLAQGSDNTVLQVKRAVINASSSGVNTIVALVSAKMIRVMAFSLQNQTSTAVTAVFESSGTDISGIKKLTVEGAAFVQGYNPKGWFETAAGVALTLNLSGAFLVSGELSYVEVA